MTFIAEDLAVTTSSDGNRLETIASRLREHLQKILERWVRRRNGLSHVTASRRGRVVGAATERGQKERNRGMQVTNPHHDHQHAPGASSQPSASPEKLPGIRHVIAVGSGKGGVGKSTVSVNLAVALQQIGGRIGLVDADILGPSIPGMLALPAGQPPTTTPDGKIVPADRHNLKVISMGMLTGDDNPAILRGPMVGKYLTMFIGSVKWGHLDYLLLDLPPGTGDTQLTLAQSYPLSGAATSSLR
jgi:ATP-binding protein involved in chromosome partitioning